MKSLAEGMTVGQSPVTFKLEMDKMLGWNKHFENTYSMQSGNKILGDIGFGTLCILCGNSVYKQASNYVGWQQNNVIRVF